MQIPSTYDLWRYHSVEAFGSDIGHQSIFNDSRCMNDGANGPVRVADLL